MRYILSKIIRSTLCDYCMRVTSIQFVVICYNSCSHWNVMLLLFFAVMVLVDSLLCTCILSTYKLTFTFFRRSRNSNGNTNRENTTEIQVHDNPVCSGSSKATKNQRQENGPAESMEELDSHYERVKEPSNEHLYLEIQHQEENRSAGNFVLGYHRKENEELGDKTKEYAALGKYNEYLNTAHIYSGLK